MQNSVLVAAAVLGGTAAGVMTGVLCGDALAAALAAAALACLMPSHRGATAWLLCALACAAAAHGAAARGRTLHPPLLAWFDEASAGGDRAPTLVGIDGVLVRDASLVEDGVRLLVDVEQVRVATAWRRAPGRVQIHVAGAQGAGHVREWTAGRRIQAPVTLRRPQMLLNFGGPSPFWQQLRRPFALAGAVKSAALVEIQPGPWWSEAAARARQFARDAVARFVTPRDAGAAGVVIAILIGDRAGLDDEVIRRLQAAGTYHVIAISGGNVALLTTMCFFALRFAMRSPRAVAGLTLLITLAYGAIVGGEPSVSRAVTAAALFLGAALAGLVPSPIATLRTAACILTIADPLTVSDVGAWLSFGATLGILVLANRIVTIFIAPDRPGWRRVVRPIVVLMAATVSAELVLAPIAAAVFGRVTLAGLLLNLVAIPAMAVVEIAGLVVVVLGAAWPVLGDLGAMVASMAANLLLSSGALVEWWPWLSWRVPGVSTTWIALYYATAALLVFVPLSMIRKRVAMSTAAVVLVVMLWAPGLERHRPSAGHLRISLIDVGQGDAILVQSPFGQALLVDAGGGPGTYDIGTRVVTPAVWSLGDRALTWLAVTHGDRDHAGGAAGVADDLDPLEIWEGVPVRSAGDIARLRQLAVARGMVWRSVRAGAHVQIGPLHIEAIHPREPDWERPRVRNDDSLVLRIRYGHVDAILTGDAGAEFEHQLPADLGAAPIRILKAGHHGSRTSTSDLLVRAMRPQVVLISVGRGNLFGHPSAEVIDRLEAVGAEVFRTDRDGAISVETDGATVWILTALGRRLTMFSSPPS